MHTLSSILLSASLSVATFAGLSHAAPSPETWQPQMGDRLAVDTRENMGYLVHPGGVTLTFPVITGQRRVVRYIGRTYDATTPTRRWVIRSKHIKGDRITFGPTGRFLRLYYKEEETPYGIHEHASEERMFSEQSRYQSMGCVIVPTNILDIIERTFDLNEGSLEVVTQYGVEDPATLLAQANS